MRFHDRFRCALVCILLAAGCAGPHSSSNLSDQDYIEVVRAGLRTQTRVLLTLDGAARWDIRYPNTRELRGQFATLIVPADPRDAERAAQMLCALMDVPESAWTNAAETGVANGFAVRCLRRGRLRSAALKESVRGTNLAWDGMLSEIDVIAQKDLAVAIVDFDAGEAAMAHTNTDDANFEYSWAMSNLKSWCDERNARYHETHLFEESFKIDDRISIIPDASVDTTTFIKLLGNDRARIAKAQQLIVRKRLNDFVTLKQQGTARVGRLAEELDPPNTVPPDVVARLLLSPPQW